MNINKVQSITFGNSKSSSNSISGDNIVEGSVGGGTAAILANGKKIAKLIPQKARKVAEGTEVVLKKTKAASKFSKKFNIAFEGAIESLGKYKLLKPVAKLAKHKIVGKAGLVIGGLAAVGALVVNLASTVNVGEKLFDAQA